MLYWFALGEQFAWLSSLTSLRRT